jgi:hypothetical protein
LRRLAKRQPCRSKLRDAYPWIASPEHTSRRRTDRSRRLWEQRDTVRERPPSSASAKSQPRNRVSPSTDSPIRGARAALSPGHRRRPGRRGRPGPPHPGLLPAVRGGGPAPRRARRDLWGRHAVAPLLCRRGVRFCRAAGRARSRFLSVFDKPQHDALAVLFLKLRGQENIAAETLWGVWLFPLAALVFRSRFLLRFLGVWLALGGFAWVALSATGVLWPQYLHQLFRSSSLSSSGRSRSRYGC